MEEKELHFVVVDDDPDLLRIIRGYLKDQYKVTLFSSGYEALDYLKTNKPDGIFLDFMMPQLTGLDVLEEIKKNDEIKSVPVFFLTSISELQQIQNIMKTAQGYLQKPVSKKELLNLISNYYEI